MRTRMVNFRLTEEEYQALYQKAEVSPAKNLSTYLRSIVFSDADVHFTHTKRQTELIRQVRKIGVNINQITARHNSGLYFASDRVQLAEQMEKLIELVEEYHGGEEESRRVGK